MRIENTVNFTNKEKHLLLDKIGPYLHVIENKSIVAAASHAKSQVWMELAGIYNSQVQDVKRTPTQLRNLYNNMKKRTRKHIKHKLQMNSSLHIDEFGKRLIILLPELRKYSRLCSNIESTRHHQPSTSSSFESLTTNTSFHDEDITVKEEVEEIFISDDPTSDGVMESMDESSNEVLCKREFYRNDKGCQVEENDVMRPTVDIRAMEIEKLTLDIKLREVQLEYMRQKLREQEINVKIKELEYQRLVSAKETCRLNNGT